MRNFSQLAYLNASLAYRSTSNRPEIDSIQWPHIEDSLYKYIENIIISAEKFDSSVPVAYTTCKACFLEKSCGRNSFQETGRRAQSSIIALKLIA